MKKSILLIPCIVFFMFSCTDITTDGDGEDGRGGRSGRRSGDGRDGSGTDRRSPVKNVCEGESYTVYSYDDCPTDGKNQGKDPSKTQSKHPVDILFVLDTSHSMYFYLNYAFERRFKNFISIINGLDWRILFTNAGYSGDGFFSFLSQGMDGEAMKLEDKYDILNKRYLDRTVPDYGNVFKYTMTRKPHRIHDRGGHVNECEYPPYCQGAEQPLRALHASFKANKHLTRKEADYVAIIISNTDENPESDVADIKEKEIIDEFNKVYGSGKRLMVLSLIVLPDDSKCKKENDDRQFWFPESNLAKQIASLAPKTGGGNFSICLKDYSIVAKSIVSLANQ